MLRAAYFPVFCTGRSRDYSELLVTFQFFGYQIVQPVLNKKKQKVGRLESSSPVFLTPTFTAEMQLYDIRALGWA
jgi:hypothetical protein